MLQILSNQLPKSFNYAGHPVQDKSLIINVNFGSSTNANNRVFLKDDNDAYQLQGKTITCIIANTVYVPTPSVVNGNLTSINTLIPNAQQLVSTAELILYGVTLTLIDINDKYIVYNYPLRNLMSTSRSRISETLFNGRVPRTFKFFNVKPDFTKCYIDSFDPNVVTKSNRTVSLTFYYKD